ncbi:MAG: type I restriction endonuclease [Anaerolineae bacterium]
MNLAQHLERIRDDLLRGSFATEAAVSNGIVLPILDALGWPIYNPRIVIPEYTLENRRADFALCHPVGKPIVFIEVKNIGRTEGADRQLFEYAFHVGIPMAILTDGQEWSMFLPAEQGDYKERILYKIDLLERSGDEAGDRFIKYLGYDRVCSGEALKDARADYRDVARIRMMKATFPSAWLSLLKEQDCTAPLRLDT